MNDTEDTTITLEEIELAELQWKARLENLDELDRFLGTVESYGGYLNIKPCWSKDVI